MKVPLLAFGFSANSARWVVSSLVPIFLSAYKYANQFRCPASLKSGQDFHLWFRLMAQAGMASFSNLERIASLLIAPMILSRNSPASK